MSPNRANAAMMGFRLETVDGILSARPLPSDEDLRAFYETKYFQEPHGNFAPTYTSDELDFINFKNRVFHQQICEHIGIDDIAGLSLLDLGAGEGFTIRYFDQLGVKVSGADFSAAGIKQHNGKLLDRVPFVQCDITRDRPFEGSTFDLVAVNGVLEHVRDPVSFLESIRSYCRQETLLFVSTPNEFNGLQMEYLGDTPKEAAPWFSPPEHLSYFTPETLRATVARAGFEIAYVGAGFPIEQFLLHHDTDYYLNPSAGKIAHQVRKRFVKTISFDMRAAAQLCAAFANSNIGRDLMVMARCS